MADWVPCMPVIPVEVVIRNAGRTKPTLWSEGGSGNYGFSSMLVYITRKNGAFFQNYGRVLHDQAIYGVKPEGKLSVKYDYQTFEFPRWRNL